MTKGHSGVFEAMTSLMIPSLKFSDCVYESWLGSFLSNTMKAILKGMSIIGAVWAYIGSE
jgi:hypothetical protein